jgi:hypothetical protein
MASDAEWGRLASAQDVFFRGLIAGLMALPALAERMGLVGLPAIAVFTVAYLGILAMWYVYGPLNPESFFSRTGRGPAIAAALALYALLFVPTIAWLISAAFMLAAWYVRLTDWPTLAPVANLRSPELRRLVNGYSSRALIVLIVATTIVLGAIIG